MKIRSVSTIPVVLLALLQVAGCAGSGAASRATLPSLGDALPQLGSLPPRQPAVTEGKVVRSGSDYETTLPSARIAVAGPLLTLTPTGSSFSELSFAIFEFDLSGYDRETTVKLDWTDAPAPSDFYLAFSDWPALKWHIEQATAQNQFVLTPEQIAAYQDGTNRLLMGILITGEDSAQLEQVRIGEPMLPPVADAQVFPPTGEAPLFIDYDMGASSDSDPGTIQGYEVDFGEGGGFEPTAVSGDHTYFLPGTYTLEFRVTDDDGNTATDSVEVTVNEPPNLPPTASFTADPMTGPAPLFVDFDAQGSTDPEFEALLFEWDFEDDGIFDTPASGNPLTSHTFAGIGIHTVRLKVTDEHFNTGETTMQIEAQAVPYDETENNDELAQADTLPAIPFTGWKGSMGSGDGYVAVDGDNRDWQGLGSVAAGFTITILMDWDPGTSLGSLTLQLYDANENALASAFNEDSDTKRINYVVQPADIGPFFLKVSQLPPPPGLDDFTDYFISASTS